MLDGADLNPAAVLAVAQGEVGIAARGAKCPMESVTLPGISRVSMWVSMLGPPKAQAARPASARLPVSW